MYLRMRSLIMNFILMLLLEFARKTLAINKRKTVKKKKAIANTLKMNCRLQLSDFHSP